VSLWTCIACTARRAVGMLTCPQCGAAEHEVGDTISGPDGVQGQPHIPQAYADAAPAAPAAPVTAPQPTPAPVIPAPRSTPADAQPEPPADTP
jgi:hypothetical protein